MINLGIHRDMYLCSASSCPLSDKFQTKYQIVIIESKTKVIFYFIVLRYELDANLML